MQVGGPFTCPHLTPQSFLLLSSVLSPSFLLRPFSRAGMRSSRFFPTGKGPLSLGRTENKGQLPRGSSPPAFTGAHVGGGAETGKNLLH